MPNANRVAGDGSGDSRDRSTFLFVSLTALVILVYAWVVALSKTANDFKLDPSYINLFQTLAFGTNIVAMCCAYSGQPIRIAVALALFVGQFIVYMIVVAFVYPHECSFTLYTSGTEYSGSEIQHMHSGSGDLIQKKNIAVECTVKICALPGICTEGGREFFTCLAHASPLVFAFGFHNALQHALQPDAAVNSLTAMLNMVDIQDFWVLFLDDEIIKNHWGRDNCDADDCSGKKGNTWWMILLFFATSSLTTLFTLVDSVFVAVSGGKHLDSLFGAIQQQPASYVFWLASANLCCLEVPFFALRLWCSYKFDVVASTLLVKNAFGILFNLVRCCYGGDVTKFAEQHRYLGAFLISAEDSLYDAMPDDENTENHGGHDQPSEENNTDNNDTGTAATSLESFLCGNIFAVSGLAVIVCAWVSVLTKTVNEFKLKHDAIEVIWLAAVALNCLAFYLFWTRNSWNTTFGLTLFVIQFPVYMTVIALTYPHECDFIVYEAGTQFKGTGIVDMGKASAGASSDDKEIKVDCDVKICFPLTDFWWSCTNGGRELFTCLAHATPLVFALGFSSALKDSLKGAAAYAVLSSTLILVNMIDIQDFWVLFLEDDIIKNYWGRDNCDSESMLFGKYRCSGRSRWTWLLLMSFFWTSILATSFLLVNCVLIVLKIKAPWNDSQGTLWGHSLLKMQALSMLLCHELPFLVLRIWCSMTFDIVASTLVVKNFVGICLMSVVWWYDGRLADAAKGAHPFFAEFLKKMAGVVHTDESVQRSNSRSDSVRDLRNEESDDDENPNHRFRAAE